MDPIINKFLVAVVTCGAAIATLLSDGVTTEEWITIGILFANSIGVYAIPNSVRKDTNLITRP